MNPEPPPATSAGFDRIDARPLRDPLLILAFSGWSDGGDAATTAASYLLQTLAVEPFARLDCEPYFDFTVVRPQARLDAHGQRELIWPDPELHAVRADPESGGRDLLIGVGEEPHLRWRTFARTFARFVTEVGVRQVIHLGAYLADVIYSQPVRVGMTSPDPEWIERFDLSPSRYEGSTGILSALSEAYAREGVTSASLWAPIPHYVTTRPHPRAALALLEKVEQVAGLSFDLSRLRVLAVEFDDEVSEAIAGDPQLAAYVRELKRRAFSR